MPMTIPAIRAPRPGAQTFLVHLTGGGLVDGRYAVRFLRSRADGDIVPVHPGGEGRGRPKPSIMTLDEVRQLTPDRDGIIIASGIDSRDCGLQIWDARATGLWHDRRLKG